MIQRPHVAAASVLCCVLILTIGVVKLDQQYSENEGENTVRVLDSFSALRHTLGPPQNVSVAHLLGARSQEWHEIVAVWAAGIEARFDARGALDTKVIPAGSRAVVVGIQAPFSGTIQFGAEDRLRIRIGDRCKEIRARVTHAALDRFHVRCEGDYDVARRIVVTAPSAERRSTALMSDRHLFIGDGPAEERLKD